MRNRTAELAELLRASGDTVYVGPPSPKERLKAGDMAVLPVSEMPLLRVPMGHLTAHGDFVECDLGPECSSHSEVVYEIREIRLRDG